MIKIYGVERWTEDDHLNWPALVENTLYLSRMDAEDRCDEIEETPDKMGREQFARVRVFEMEEM